MEQGSTSQPNLQSLDRLTGKAVFFPVGAAGGVDLGDISLHALSYGAKRETRRFPVSRAVLFEIEETVCMAPVFSIEGSQFHSAIVPYILLATRNTDVTQAALTRQTATIASAQPEQTFDIGARNITNVTASIGSALLSPNIDYFVDTNKGLIRFPASGGIMGGESVTVRFDQAQIVRRSYTAFDVLEFPGRLLLFEMEAGRLTPKTEWSILGNITCESLGDGDPEKHRKWKLRFSLTGQPLVLRRDEQAIFAGGTIPSNALVDENGIPILDEFGNFIFLS